MKRVKLFLAALSLSSVSLLSGSSLFAGDDDNWVRIRLDERFRSEGVAAADVNNDGNPDVIAGDVWYEAPSLKSDRHTDGSQWKLHEVRVPGEFVAGVGYSNSFCNFAHDMNKDGNTDVVIIGFPGDPFHWYENPGPGKEDHWKQHVIWTSVCNESPEFEDLNGDGVRELILGSQPEAKMGFNMIPGADKSGEMFPFHAISEAGDPNQNGTFKYYHGLGVGDMNGDKHPDVLIAHGWWQNPGDITSGKVWDFHPVRIKTDNGEQPLPACANLYADDFDSDGDMDLFLSSAHNFGVWWAENPGEGAWTLHEIDKSFSQTHAVERVDINGDGQLDYVTGKRFFAHNGGDPGAHDPVVMVWFEVQRSKGNPPKFTAHHINAGLGTGVGTQFEIYDMNKDKKPDIVLSNKKGVNVLLQK
ncbi:MAG: VCBS repeat-containing protein [Planctomycetaceae bacterium]